LVVLVAKAIQTLGSCWERAGLCIEDAFGLSLFILITPITARTITKTLRETVIEAKLIPIGDNPKNKPTRPSKPKLSAIDNTNASTKSTLFLPLNKMLTKQ
jgi:hypothetical protein